MTELTWVRSRVGRGRLVPVAFSMEGMAVPPPEHDLLRERPSGQLPRPLLRVPTASSESVSTARASRAAGIGYLLLFGLAVVANFFLGDSLVAVGAAYLVDTSTHAVLAAYGEQAGSFFALIAMPSAIAKCCFGLWLLSRARRSFMAR